MTPGIYILLLHLDNKKRIKVGKLGVINFEKGYYVYVGSAQKNLEKRIQRHLSNEKKLRWHIDYLLKHAKIIKIFIKKAKKDEEAKTAFELSEKFSYVKNFGSSDSKAPSHLFFINNLKLFEKIVKKQKFIPL